jgi:hypothetical protein
MYKNIYICEYFYLRNACEFLFKIDTVTIPLNTNVIIKGFHIILSSNPIVICNRYLMILISLIDFCSNMIV